jgi:serine/threonine-protein kinase
MTPQQLFAHYRIVSKLGEGGMGEVWRATDTKLNRDVAIKILPEAFAHDADRMARFTREAQVLASLNHPNIAAIYGLEESGSVGALVMELVEGPTLADRIRSGSSPWKEALHIARQIAEGLESAHERGIVHRDLKPANVKVTPEGNVKVLDFGLAKATEPLPASSRDPAASPTVTLSATREGSILGTAAYMAPEQARGVTVDARADIWSFGAVLYEMLSGRPAFPGGTASDVLAAILRADPDWSALPAAMPRAIHRLMARCLERDRKRRLQAIGEARIAIEDALDGDAEPAPVRPSHRAALPWIAAVAILAAAAGAGWWRSLRAGPGQSVLPPVSFAIGIPSGGVSVLGENPVVAVSNDGRLLVYATGGLLFQRAIDRLEPVAIPGTQGAMGPFLSPDGQSVGFFADGKLKRASLRGGAPIVICDASAARGASWGPDDRIVFSGSLSGGLMRVPASGGKPEALTTVDASKGERTHRWPKVLPSGKNVLYTVGWLQSPNDYDNAAIVAQSLETGARRTLVEGARMARFAPPDRLVYQRGTTLFAASFDPAKLTLTSRAVPVHEGVGGDASSGSGFFAFGGDGTLAYVPARSQSQDLRVALVDRSGAATVLNLPPRLYRNPRFSPDGRRLVFTIGTGSGADDDIWICDLATLQLSHLTFGATGLTPLWTPDGQRIVFNQPRGTTTGLYWKAANGSGAPELLWASDSILIPSSWSPDGSTLAVNRNGQADALWLLPIHGDRKPRSLGETQQFASVPAFSPDGKWIAYGSVESGTNEEVYVRPVDASGGKWQVSTEGGSDPVWQPNGSELYYTNGDQMMAAPVQTRPAFHSGTPRKIFEGRYETRTAPTRNFDLSPDGKKFVMLQRAAAEGGSRQIDVELNWLRH